MTQKRARILQWSLVIPLIAFSFYQLYVGITAYTIHSAALLETGPVTERAKVFSKIHRDGEKQYLWARGPKVPDDESSEWFDMTGSPVELETINHGIGKDEIASIDNPVFVKPDDPRLLRKWAGGDIEENGKLRVICYANTADARAYPVTLMNRHELVNDVVGGTPVTVGW